MIPIAARFEGVQDFPGRSSFALWTIWEDIPGHPKRSTVSINTLHEAGYEPVEREAS
jgi:hypothetical protein